MYQFKLLLNNLIEKKYIVNTDVINVRKIVKVIVGILILGLLYYFVGFVNILDEFQKIDLSYLPTILLLLLATFFLNALNIYIMTRPIKKISFKKSIEYYFYSWSLGFFGLGKIGEFSIIYWLKKENLTTGQASAIAIVDKLITFGTLAILSVVGVIALFGFAESLQLIGIMGLLSLLGVFFVFTEKGRTAIKKILQSRSQKFSGFGDTTDAYLKQHKAALVLNTFVTFGRWIAQAFFAVFLFASFGFQVNVIPMLFMIAISTVVSFIPISFNGLGVKEAAFTSLAVTQNWAVATTVSVLTISLALNYAVLVIVLLVFAKELRKYKTEQQSH